MTPRQVDIALFIACEKGSLDDVKQLVDEMDGDVCFQEPETGISLLMVAAGSGMTEVVKYLLSEGAPWNAVDKKYLCAGDYAARNGHQDCIDVLMYHAVVTESLLSLSTSDTLSDTLDKGNKIEHSKPLNASYLASRLDYSQDGSKLIDSQTGLAVMMKWEELLMEKHAAWICHSDTRPVDDVHKKPLRVLNVGFGMGIVDKEIQKYKPTSHVIIEAHPDVLKKINEEQWDCKSGVQIIPERWQDAVGKLCEEIEADPNLKFDGIFFDTYAEDDHDLKEFHQWLPKLLRNSENETGLSKGRYSYYNGLCPDNVFFHGVLCEVIRLQLGRLGLECTFESVPVDVSKEELWKDITSRYWHFDTYFFPKCIFVGDELENIIE